MTPESLVRECEKRGVAIRLAGKGLALSGGPDAVKLAADLLRPFKAELVQYLGHLASNDPAPPAAQSSVTGERYQPYLAPASNSISARVAVFRDRGLNQDASLALALQLETRDTERDDRRVCLECAYLSGGGRSWSCSQWRRTGMKGPPTPADLIDIPQRCAGFALHLRINEKGRP